MPRILTQGTAARCTWNSIGPALGSTSARVSVSRSWTQTVTTSLFSGGHAGTTKRAQWPLHQRLPATIAGDPAIALTSRKNWLFAGSMRGGRAAAVIYTVVECCRRSQLDVLAYLADVLVRVATHPANKIVDLLPANQAARFAPPTCATA
ncbi:MAG: transposase domain-containing protein [Planctomycetes bacterium]|nr:transposase domain-containing protein [Planctomycetota bacterium]